MNGIFGCNSCSWVLILVIIFLLCQNGDCGNSCGCGNNCGSIGGSNSGCGCGNGCGCDSDYNGCGCGCN